jgi:hypothetical protein
VRHLGVTAGGLEVVSCALCDGDVWRTRFRKAGTTIVECRRCGLFVNPGSPGTSRKRYNSGFHQGIPARSGVIEGHVDLNQVDSRHGALLTLMEHAMPQRGRLFDVGAAGVAAGRGGASRLDRRGSSFT